MREVCRNWRAACARVHQGGAARAARDFAEADLLRHEIAEHGWDVRDVASGYELVPRS